MLEVPLLLVILMLCAGVGYVFIGRREAAVENRVRQRMQFEGRLPLEEGSALAESAGQFLEWVGRQALRTQASFNEWRTIAAAAGFWEIRAAYRLAGLRFVMLIMISGTGILILLFSGNEREGLGALLVIAGCIIFVAVKPALEWRRRARLERVARELPFFIESMLLMLRSGANLDQSFRQVAKTEPYAMPEIHAATAALVDQLEHGVSYQVALDRWSFRLGTELTSDLSSAFTQSLVMGTEISRVLRSYGQLFIERRLLQARERSGKRLVQLTIVMLLLFLPPLLLILGAPAVEGLMSAFKSV